MKRVPPVRPGKKPDALIHALPIAADLAAKLYPRIMSKVEAEGDCLVRTVSVTPEGYTRVSINTEGRCRQLFAHRVVWTHLRGPIPAGFTIDHVCKNRRCVNVEHLEPVTQRTNSLRSSSIFAQNSAKERCPQGHDFAEFPDGRRYCPVCKSAWKGDPLPPDDKRHGTVGGYTNYGCRCDPCKLAMKQSYRRYYLANREKRIKAATEYRKRKQAEQGRDV